MKQSEKETVSALYVGAELRFCGISSQASMCWLGYDVILLKLAA